MRKHSDYEYIQKKMEHLKRVGLVAKTTTRGKHGGACPDWLRREQQSEREEEKEIEGEFLET